MLTAPAEINNKFGEGSLVIMFKIFIAASMEVVSIAILIIVGLFFSRSLIEEGGNIKYIISACIIFIGALASNYVFVIAAYYPARNTICMLIMTLVALSILYAAINNFNIKKLECCVLAALMTFCCAKIAYGFYDIYTCYQQTKEIEQTIIDASMAGMDIVEVENVKTRTKYAIVTHIKTQEEVAGSSDFPNRYIAKYYGIEAVYGKK